jgi:hypothetical protein
MDRFEADVMDDLMYDAGEGPAGSATSAYDEYDEYDEGDEYDEYDEGDEGDDEFLGRLIGGLGRAAGGALRRRAGGGRGGAGGGLGGMLGGLAGQRGGLLGADEYDEFDEADEYDEVDEIDGYDEFDAGDDIDSLEDAVADALDAADGDEFFGRLRRLASGAANIARRVGRGVGAAARVVGPLASMIPLPQAQMIGRIANVAGRLLADGADEFEAFDELVDGLDDEAIDAAAPVLAGMVVRRAVPSSPAPHRPCAAPPCVG